VSAPFHSAAESPTKRVFGQRTWGQFFKKHKWTWADSID
jgi:hypothetical protein